MAYTQIVSSGVTVTGELVDSGIQTITSGGIASNAIVSGGSISVEKGGVKLLAILVMPVVRRR